MTKPMSMETAAITVRHVQQRHEARAERLRKRAELDREIKEDDDWLAAAKVLFGTDFVEPITATAEIGADESMAQAAVRILNSTDLWTDYDRLRERLAETEKFAAMLSSSPNYFYTMIRRLIGRDEIERRGKLLRGLKKVSI